MQMHVCSHVSLAMASHVGRRMHDKGNPLLRYRALSVAGCLSSPCTHGDPASSHTMQLTHAHD